MQRAIKNRTDGFVNTQIKENDKNNLTAQAKEKLNQTLVDGSFFLTYSGREKKF